VFAWHLPRKEENIRGNGNHSCGIASGDPPSNEAQLQWMHGASFLAFAPEIVMEASPQAPQRRSSFFEDRRIVRLMLRIAWFSCSPLTSYQQGIFAPFLFRK
jgi:hypothetical protein